jgi:hypothetical protein
MAVTLGAVLLFGLWTDATVYLPFFLFVIGFGTWVSSIGFLGSRPEATSRNLDRPGEGFSTEPRHPTSPPKEAKSPEVTPRHWDLHLHSGLGHAAVSATTRTGDELWRRWAVPPARPLGVEVAGPLPETAYSPPHPGGFVAFPSRDTDLQFPVPGGSRPSTTKATQTPIPASDPQPDAAAPTDVSRASREPLPIPTAMGPFSESELDALFPLGPDFSPVTEHSSSSASSRPRSHAFEPPRTDQPVPEGPALRGSGRSDLNTPAAARTPGPLPERANQLESTAVSSGLEVGPLLAGPVGLLPTLDSLDHLVALEAVNPMPPHLRVAPSSDADRRTPGRTRAGTSGGFRWTCAECSQGLTELRAWVECPKCSRPICRRCLTLSFLTGADGHCTECHRGRSTAVA